MPETTEENKPAVVPKAESTTNLIEKVYTGTAENTYFQSPYVSDSYDNPWNPDDIYKKRSDYSIYEDMVLDDQISVCLKMKKDLVLGSGFEIIPGDEGQEEIAEDLQVALKEDVEVPFSEMLEEILSAYEFGFSLSEKIFMTKPDGKLRLKCLKTRHPNSWLMYQDKFGSITKYEQKTIDGDKAMEPASLIHFVNNRKFQNPYGVSDLRPAYAAWFAKRQVIRYFAIFLEKAASPIPVASYDKNAPEAAVTKLFDTIKQFQTKTALAIPKEIEIQFLEAKNTGDAFSKAIDIFNLFIARSLFVPDLLGISGEKTSGGSYSLGKEQIKMFFNHIYRRRETLEKIINQEIIWPMVIYNFGYVDNYPKFRFKPLDDGSAAEMARVWLEAVKSRVFKPNEEEINYFRSLVGFPQGEIEIPEMAVPQSPFGQNQGQAGKTQEKEEMPEKESSEQEAEKKEFSKPFKLPPGDYHKKVDFKKLKTKLEDYDNSVMNDTAPVVNKILTDLFDQIQKKKIIQSGNAAKADTLKLKYLKELNTVLKASFMQLYKDAKSQAATEILKGVNFAKPLVGEDFLELLDQENYNFIGDYEYNVIKKAKSEIINAIKDGQPKSALMEVLEEELKKMSQVSIERYARTKHTEVMNKGRHEFFEESGVVAAYQYSAIMDDRTSDVCAGLDGKIFAAGTEPIPPMHFNCRSLLIPITKYEEFTPTKSIQGMDPQDFIDENKGKGFPTK